MMEYFHRRECLVALQTKQKEKKHKTWAQSEKNCLKLHLNSSIDNWSHSKLMQSTIFVAYSCTHSTFRWTTQHCRSVRCWWIKRVDAEPIFKWKNYSISLTCYRTLHEEAITTKPRRKKSICHSCALYWRPMSLCDNWIGTNDNWLGSHITSLRDECLRVQTTIFHQEKEIKYSPTTCKYPTWLIIGFVLTWKWYAENIWKIKIRSVHNRKQRKHRQDYFRMETPRECGIYFLPDTCSILDRLVVLDWHEVAMCLHCHMLYYILVFLR